MNNLLKTILVVSVVLACMACTGVGIMVSCKASFILGFVLLLLTFLVPKLNIRVSFGSRISFSCSWIHILIGAAYFLGHPEYCTLLVNWLHIPF